MARRAKHQVALHANSTPEVAEATNRCKLYDTQSKVWNMNAPKTLGKAIVRCVYQSLVVNQAVEDGTLYNSAILGRLSHIHHLSSKRLPPTSPLLQVFIFVQ